MKGKSSENLTVMVKQSEYFKGCNEKYFKFEYIM